MKIKMSMTRYVLQQFFLEPITFDTDDFPELKGKSREEIEKYLIENVWRLELPDSADNVYHDEGSLGSSLAAQSEEHSRHIERHPDNKEYIVEYPKSGYSVVFLDEN